MIEDNKIKSINIFTDRFANEEGFKNVLANLSDIRKQIINNHNVIQASFYDDHTSQNFAWALFHQGNCIEKRFNIIPFDDAGIRITNKLIDLPEFLNELFLKNLNSYFSKPGKGQRSKYKAEKDFIFDIFLLSDGLKALSIDSERVSTSVNIYKELPKYLLNKFKTVNEVPFHKLIITFEDIEKAIDKLEDFYYHTLAVWFFPEREARNKKGYNEAQSLKSSKSRAKYLISQRRKDQALKCLAENICDTQKDVN